MDTLQFDDILAARERIASSLYLSPCPPSVPLSEVTGSNIFCKLDYLQRTGSFKERGACNALMLLSPERRSRGVIAASAGNHALGLAYHGHRLGIDVTVVMPRYAPLIKVSTCRRLGANIVLHGDDFPAAREHALELARESDRYFIPAFDDPAVIAGQGTMGLEILEQVSDVDTIVVPVGGGGLIAGIALAVKTLRPEVSIVGVEPERAAGFAAGMMAGRPVPIDLQSTVADGLAVAEVGELPLRLAHNLVDEVVTVTEDELALAMLRIAELEKGVVEGAAAAPLAAVLARKVSGIAGKNVVLPLCGGNIDPLIFCRVLEQGLVADGRLTRLTALIKDRPGTLSEFAGLIASAGAGIREISHERAFAGPDVSEVHVLCIVETRDRAHIQAVHEALKSNGVRFFVPPNVPI